MTIYRFVTSYILTRTIHFLAEPSAEDIQHLAILQLGMTADAQDISVTNQRGLAMVAVHHVKQDLGQVFE
ncbi:MAG: hypothetical protein UZ18_ATM001002423 [Armatimonadetes bacterium OLB18]|nr:MAG: hypothetical protein UZ18_ATM001002423 [Armatimonadetes bacterium OLB18]